MKHSTKRRMILLTLVASLFCSCILYGICSAGGLKQNDVTIKEYSPEGKSEDSHGIMDYKEEISVVAAICAILSFLFHDVLQNCFANLRRFCQKLNTMIKFHRKRDMIVFNSKACIIDIDRNPITFKKLLHKKARTFKIPSGVNCIGERAFEGCSSLSSIAIPSSVTSIEDGAFQCCSVSKKIDVDKNNPNYCSIDGVLFTKGQTILILCPRGKKDYSIPHEVRRIGNSAFEGCSSLSSVVIPSDVTSIGKRAFLGCSSLSSVNIFSRYYTSIYIEQGAFEDCSDLSLIDISTVVDIGEWAFKGCSSLSSIVIPYRVSSIERGTFCGCSSLSSIVIPDSVKSIGVSAFLDCSSLSSIEIPDSVKSIGEWAFSGCSSLASVTIPSSVPSIKYGTFFGCSSLSSIKICSGVTRIGALAFKNCSSLSVIEIPPSVGSINIEAFSGCSSLMRIEIDENNPNYCSFEGLLLTKDQTTLVMCPPGRKDCFIPSSVKSIGEGAFFGCSSLSSLVIPASVTRIGEGAFFGCSSLTSVDIPSSVSSIGYGAFSGCSSLTSIEIPLGVTSVEAGAFQNCSSLTEIEVDSNNPKYCSYDGALFTKDQKILILCPPGRHDYTIPDGVTSVGESAFRGCSSLSSLVIPAGVTCIGKGAFSDCSSLSSLVIPAGVTSIGDWAFSNCSSLYSLVIPVGVTSIGESAFSYCLNLVLRVPKGSYAEQYAKENKIKYETIE